MGSKLRIWQREALTIYRDSFEAGTRSLLWEATPGAGKTTAALRLCVDQLRRRGARRVIVVVPTTHLKRQWAHSALNIGLHLDSNFGDNQRTPSRDFHGIVVTYQQVGNRPQLFAALSKQCAVVLDEVHHAGDGLSWGDALRAGFKNANFILCLSGTAFRSDNNAIPFVIYDQGGMSCPDYVYSYAQAIVDRVCRPTVFFTYGGEIAWNEGGQQVQAAFSDAIDKTQRTRRLRAALDARSGWIEPMLRDAHEMLQVTRGTHPNAGALLVASSQNHARELARVLRETTGVKPVVVLSEEVGAAERLKRFQHSDEPWLVACNMVSEGVDIPRLRVGVYATTIRTKMYFRQFLGRIVRRTEAPRGTQPAFCYLPADPWLRVLAEEIEQEQRHCLKAVAEGDDFEFDPEVERKERSEDEKPSWEVLRATNRGVDAVIMGGAQLSLWDSGDSPQHQAGPVSFNDTEEAPPASHFEQPLSRSELKEEIVREIRGLVALYHQRSGEAYSHIHSLLNRQQSVSSQKACTEGQLRERLRLLQRMLAVE